MHDISVAAVALLLALGCQGDKKKPAPASNDQTATQTATKPAPPPPNKQGGLRVDSAPAPKIALDCDKLLVADDLEKICGIEGVWKKDPFETGAGPTSCSRRAGPNAAFVRFSVGVYPHTESARAVTRGAQPGKIKIERKRAGGASTVVAHTRKGNIAVSVSSTQMARKKQTCTDEQLGQLALVIESRLP